MISAKLFENYSNRGMALEDDINLTNEYYLNKNDIPNNKIDIINNPISHNSSLL